MRVIDADALVAELAHAERAFYERGINSGETRYAYASGIIEKCKEQAQKAPTLDYAPVKHGWLEHIGFLTCRCSECKTTFHELPCENYCPNCGALMDGKEDGKDV